MEVDPQRLADHLERLDFRETKEGIQRVLLRDRFACVARTMDSTLIVAAPALEGVEPLPKEIGMDLHPLIGSLRLLMFRERDYKGKWLVGRPADLSLTSERLVLKGVLKGQAVTMKLRRVPPSLVESQVDPEVAEELFRRVPDGPGVPLALTEWLEDARQWLEEGDFRLPREEWTEIVPLLAAIHRACKVVLEVGPKGGHFIIAGGRAFKPAGVSVAKIGHYLTAEKPYKLTFTVQPLANLLHKLRHAPDPRIHLAGPRKPVLFTTGDGFKYLLSARLARRTL